MEGPSARGSMSTHFGNALLSAISATLVSEMTRYAQSASACRSLRKMRQEAGDFPEVQTTSYDIALGMQCWSTAMAAMSWLRLYRSSTQGAGRMRRHFGRDEAKGSSRVLDGCIAEIWMIVMNYVAGEHC